MLDMQLRVRQKEAKRKDDEAVDDANKKRCEREERMAEVQLKAYWTCYSLHPDLMRPEISKRGNLKRDKLRTPKW